jgi:site-specific recombinase XerD
MIVETGFQANAKRFDQLIAGATAKYNLALKEIVKQSGINKSIASHQARISFVTNAAQSGIPLTTIQGILKHSKMDMTAHYSKFVDNQGDAALVDFERKIIEK